MRHSRELSSHSDLRAVLARLLKPHGIGSLLLQAESTLQRYLPGAFSAGQETGAAWAGGAAVQGLGRSG
ncbi:MAG TPA: hypothetical protein VLY04_24730, partial [Bryobacteraceae bacterium]|nr:hypothetical protein [Bryobacteraceae bacterium]